VDVTPRTLDATDGEFEPAPPAKPRCIYAGNPFPFLYVLLGIQLLTKDCNRVRNCHFSRMNWGTVAHFLALLLNEVGEEQFRAVHFIRLQARSKEFASDTDSGEVYAGWFITKQVYDPGLYPVGLAFGVLYRLIGVLHQYQYQNAVSVVSINHYGIVG
jgi:hypothetical protein